jgi:hypothetical protein
MFALLGGNVGFESFLMDINREKKTRVFSDKLGQLATMIINQDHANFAFKVVELHRTGISFKEMELYFRTLNINCWFIALGSSPKYTLSVLLLDSYDAYKQHFNKKSAYTENFNKLDECEFLIKK